MEAEPAKEMPANSARRRARKTRRRRGALKPTADLAAERVIIKLSEHDPRERNLELAAQPTAGEVLERIRSEGKGAGEKGQWFEEIAAHVPKQEPIFEIESIRRGGRWPDRGTLTS